MMDRDPDCGEPSVKSRRRFLNEDDDEDSCQHLIDNSTHVLGTLERLYKERQMSDVCLVVGEREHHAHRLILCASSDVFQVMLTKSEWCESQKSSVVLQEMPKCVNFFHLFLEYLYTGKILITHTNVMPILALADKYIVKGLSRLCVEYMCKHVPHAALHNQLFLWLQYCAPCGHLEIVERCQNYIKWNLEFVANTPDFSNMDVENLIALLQESDVVVYNEMVLYNCVVRWLELQQVKLRAVQPQMPEPQIEQEMNRLVESAMAFIRFPMMTPRDLAELLLSPIVQRHRDFFMEKMALGMAYHSGHVERLGHAVRGSPEGRLLVTPRLYTSDNFSAVLVIERVDSAPSYHTSTFMFSSHLSPADCESDSITDWMVDLYPKGVWFQKCYMIVWQAPVEIPEEIIRTVRLSLTCSDLPTSTPRLRVKVTILIYGVQGGVEHVMEVREKLHQFTSDDKIMNIDDLIPFGELNPPATVFNRRSAYLVGPDRNRLQLKIVISSLTCPV